MRLAGGGPELRHKADRPCTADGAGLWLSLGTGWGDAVVFQFRLALVGHPIGGPGGRNLLIYDHLIDPVIPHGCAHIFFDHAGCGASRICGAERDAHPIALIGDIPNNPQIHQRNNGDFRIRHLIQPLPNCVDIRGLYHVAPG